MTKYFVTYFNKYVKNKTAYLAMTTYSKRREGCNYTIINPL